MFALIICVAEIGVQNQTQLQENVGWVIYQMVQQGFLCFLFFLFLAAPGHMEFWSHGFSNTGSSIHCAEPGTNLHPSASQLPPPIPLHPSRTCPHPFGSPETFIPLFSPPHLNHSQFLVGLSLKQAQDLTAATTWINAKGLLPSGGFGGEPHPCLF